MNYVFAYWNKQRNPHNRIILLSGLLLLCILVISFCEEDQKNSKGKDYCAFYLTGEMDTQGLDTDGDGIPNSMDYCPDNPHDWLDSDRDGIGNQFDNDIDGDGIPNEEDEDMDGDLVSNAEEISQGTDPMDPSSVPGHPDYTYDQGILNPNPGWYKGDLHMHTTYSDGHVSVDYRVKEAERYGLDFMSLTDHNTMNGLFDPDWQSTDVLLIPGMEFTMLSHFNEFGLKTNNLGLMEVESVMKAWNLTKLQGANVSLNHYGHGGYNVQWDMFTASNPEIIEMLDAMEVWNTWEISSYEKNKKSIDYWHSLLNQGYKIPAIGGSDSHTATSPICFPTTYIYARNLSTLAILDGMRKGRTYIANAYPYYLEGQLNFANTPELVFEADANLDGRYEAMIGDSVRLGKIRFHFIITNAVGEIQVIKNGDVLLSWDDHASGTTVEETFEDTPTGYSWYRINMYADGGIEHHTLISSPVYVE